MLMGLGVMYVFRFPSKYWPSDLDVSTAVCCTVRTALSGSLTDKDLSCKPLIGHTIQTCADCAICTQGATVANVGWRLPEVNIGIVCANAPILRPLYLFFRGRLQTQQTTAITNQNKERTWPSNATRKHHKILDPLSNKNATSSNPAVEVEMGLPLHKTAPLEWPLEQERYSKNIDGD